MGMENKLLSNYAITASSEVGTILSRQISFNLSVSAVVVPEHYHPCDGKQNKYLEIPGNDLEPARYFRQL